MAGGFDFVSQLQGPVIPIDLFSDNASKGIAAGNSLPTATTAAIDGAIKGYQTGQQIEATGQQNTIRQNQIDQIPVTNQIQNDQLRNAELTTQVNELKVQAQTQLQGQSLEEQHAQLTDQITKLNQDNALRQKTNDFYREMNKADPKTQLDLTFGSKYADVFASNKDLYQQSLQRALVNPEVTSDQKDNIETLLNRSKAVDYYEKEAAKRAKPFSDAKEGVIHDPLTLQLQKSTNLTPEDMATNIEFQKTGKYKPDANGDILLDGSKQPIVYPVDPSVHTYIAINKGKIVASDVDKSSMIAYGKYQNELAYQNGDYGRRAASKFGQTKDTSNGPAPSGGPSPTLNLFGAKQSQDATEPMVNTLARKNLGLGDAQVETLGPTLNDLDKYAKNYATDASFRNSPDAQLTRTKLVNTISQQVLSDQFRSSPAIQNEYNDKKAAQVNKAIEQQIGARTSSFRRNAFAAPEEDDNGANLGILAAFGVEGGEDLYVQTNLPLVQSKIDSVLNSLQKNYSENATLASKRVDIAQKRLSFFQAQLSGASGSTSR